MIATLLVLIVLTVFIVFLAWEAAKSMQNEDDQDPPNDGLAPDRTFYERLHRQMQQGAVR